MIESLVKVRDCGNDPCYMTAEEGAELAQHGYIVVNPNDVCPTNKNALRVMITEKGLNAIASSQVASGPSFQLRSDVPVPQKNSRKQKVSPYPFDQMEIGQSFHVPVSSTDSEPWKALNKAVNAENKKYEKSVVPEVLETKTVKTRVKNQDGTPAVDSDGKPVYIEKQVTKPKMVQTRLFKCFKTGSTDPDGVGCRVFRLPI